ncbi:hypothetical protein NC99_36540 [Sunxiuqinia dokdonensis]|uniref:Uncharacterized protein n=1 Tax=Sunxiuqinia dokdonensis TaxID=1409788 RepID=A0A0L8V508_9BACT|nr:hypothetical protein NC99_36540 [Sunxiuqinia dokdonensis]
MCFIILPVKLTEFTFSTRKIPSAAVYLFPSLKVKIIATEFRAVHQQ